MHGERPTHRQLSEPQPPHSWSVGLDFRDLGGHLARAGTLSWGVKDATHGVAAVGALPLGVQVKLGLVRGKHLPAGLHAVEASYVSAPSLAAFRAAIVRSVWSRKMHLANTPVVLSLLDGTVGVDPAFHIIWTRFRVMRGVLAHRPDEDPRPPPAQDGGWTYSAFSERFF